MTTELIPQRRPLRIGIAAIIADFILQVISFGELLQRFPESRLIGHSLQEFPSRDYDMNTKMKGKGALGNVVDPAKVEVIPLYPEADRS